MSGGKTKAVTPRLRFPEFRDAGPWEVKRLGEIAEVVRGGSPRPISQFLTTDDDGFNWLKIGDIATESKYVLSTEEKIKKTGLSKTREVQPGDLILSNSMSFGRPYIMGIRACIHDGWLALTDLKSEWLSEYLYYFILSDLSQRYLHDAAAGGGVRNLNADIVKLLPIATPLRAEEQQKIANCLSSIDELIRAEASRLEALQAHKKGLMQQLFPREGETNPRLRFPEFRDAGPWEAKKVGEIFRVTRGNVLATSLISDNVSVKTPYPVYSSQTKNNGLLGYYSDFLYEDSITWTTDGANAGDVKFRKGKFYCTNVCGVLNNEEGYANTFVAELLNSVARKHVSYVGNPKLMNGVMAQIEIPLPTIEEQQKIADCLSSLDDLIRAQGEKIEALQQHKKGLMQQLFPQEVV